MNNPLVSVCCITYNHSSFIQDCLESFLLQKTNFDVEFLIHDDASTDNTQQIIKEFVGEDARFKLLLRKTNIKSTGKAIFPLLYEQAKGKYIAMCEGDDYWTDDFKLQKQVDFLEGHKDFSICGGLAKRTYDNPALSDDIEGEAGVFEQKDLTQRNFIPTASVIFRQICVKDYPKWLLSSPIGDWPLFLICSNYGKVKVFNETFVLRRIHSGGVWGANINTKKNIENIERLMKMFEILKNKFSDDINQRLKDNYIRHIIKLIQLNLREKQFSKIEEYLNLIFKEGLVFYEETENLTAAITNKLLLQKKEISDLKELNNLVMNSSSYKIGRRLTGFFKFKKSTNIS